MRRAVVLLISFWISLPVLAQNPAGYPLPDNLQPITAENADQLTLLTSVGGELPGTLAWSPDGTRLAVGTTDKVRLYQTGQWARPPLEIPGNRHLRFDAGGNVVSAGQISSVTGERVGDDVPKTPGGTMSISYRQQDSSTVIVLTNLQSRDEIVLNTGFSGTINRIVFSPDEQFAALLMLEQRLNDNGYPDLYTIAQLWDIAAPKILVSRDLVWTYNDDDNIDTFGFHQQGKLLVMSSRFDGLDGSISDAQIWDGRTGRELAKTEPAFGSIVFSPDDTLILIPTWNGLLLWSDHEIGYLTDSFSFPVFSADGSLLVGYSPATNLVSIWDTNDALRLSSPKRTFLGTNSSYLALSPDNTFLTLIAMNNQLQVINLNTGETQIFIGSIDIRVKPQFSPNSQWIMTKRLDTQRFALWDARTGEYLISFEENFALDPTWTYAAQWINSRAVQILSLPSSESTPYLSPIENYVGETHVFEPDSGRVLFAHQALDLNSGETIFANQYLSPPVKYGLSADWGRLLTVGERGFYNAGIGSDRYKAYVQDFAQGDPPTTLTAAEIPTSTIVFLTPDGQWVGFISFTSDNGNPTSRLEMRSVETEEEANEWLLPGGVDVINFSHDGHWLVLGSGSYPDGWLIFIDLTQDISQATPIVRPVNFNFEYGDLVLQSLSFSPDDRRLTVVSVLGIGGDGIDYTYTTKTWDAQLLLAEPSLGESFSRTIYDVHAPILSRNSKLMIATRISGFNNTLSPGDLQLWDLVANQQIIALPGDDGIAAFSPDNHLVLLHRDGSTLVYRLDDLRRGAATPLTTIPDAYQPVQQIAFNPAGNLLYIVSDSHVSIYGVQG